MSRKIIVSILLVLGLLLGQTAPALAAAEQYTAAPATPGIEETAEQPAVSEEPPQAPSEQPPQPSESVAPTEQPPQAEPVAPAEPLTTEEPQATAQQPPASQHLSHSGEPQEADEEQSDALQQPHTAQLQTAEAMDPSGVVRVKLSIGDTTALSFFVDGNYTVNGAALERQLYTVKLEGGTLNLYYMGALLASGPSIRLVQHTKTDGRNNFIVLYNTNWKAYLGYLGDMEFSISGSSISAVNHVYMEDYLYGVVPSEMSDSYPGEALKAQAVSARTYAEMEMNSSDPYDLSDTSSDYQAYKGFNKDMAHSIEAVNQTAKTIISSDGTSPALTFFSASNGGITEIPQHVWNKDNLIQPYQVIQKDDADIQNPCSKMDVLILPKNLTSGAQITYQYNDDKGVIYTGEDEGVKATNYFHDLAFAKLQTMGYTSLDAMTGINSVTPKPLGGQHDVLDYNKSNACGRSSIATVNMTVTATRPDPVAGLPATIQESIAIDFDIDFTLMADKDNPNKNYFVFDQHPSLRLFTVADDGTNISIIHRGFGQGIGLSQRGAEQRANSTDPTINTYDKILGFYYPNTALVTQTYNPPVLTPAAAPDYTNASVTGNVNLRSVPTTSSNDPIWMMLKGGRIEVVQTNVAVTGSTTWHKIFFGGQYAYVAASYVQLDGSTAARQPMNVTYQTNGGSAVNAPAVYHADSIAAPSTSRLGYTFAGWFMDPGLTVPAAFPYLVTGGVTFYAKWTEINCTVTFDPQNGNGASGTTVLYGTPINPPVQPARFGFNFTGWYAGGAPVSFPYTVTGSVTLSAGWAQQPATNFLQNVALSSGSLNRGFSRAVTSYKITIGENDGSFTLTPIKEFDGAAMTINGRAVPNYTVNLANGKSAKITVKVTYAKKSKTYSFTVTRAKSGNNYLGSLSVSAGALSQPFDPNVPNYTLYLDENTKSTAIRAYAAAGKAASVSPASSRITLNNGQSKTVRITVKAQSGARRTYTITVVRAASSNANLKSLKCGGLTPGFSPGNTNYTVVLPANKSSVAISAAAAGYKAVVRIDGGKASKKITLANGQTITVRVTVVSQAGTAKDYVITVVRR